MVIIFDPEIVSQLKTQNLTVQKNVIDGYYIDIIGPSGSEMMNPAFKGYN